jgi:putative ABC transport system substrate-binding protein
VKRRRFIAVLAGAAVWSLTAYAQLSERMRRVGALIAFPENDPNTRASLAAFMRTLAQLGWAEGKNIRIDYRFAAGDPTLFKTYAAELVGLSPDLLLAGNTPAAVALRQQTQTIPIVFILVADPIGQGFVRSFARPSGEMTGFSSFDPPIMGKWLQLLKEIAPQVTRIAVIFNPDTAPYAPLASGAIESAAPSLGMTVTLAPVHDDAGIEEAIRAESRESAGGLIILPDAFNEAHRDVIIAAAARSSMPLIGAPTFPKAGGLMSYWFDIFSDPYVKGASYIDRILKGANPADLPVQQPTKYSLIINLKTAKTLGLTVRPSMLDLADEVIE